MKNKAPSENRESKLLVEHSFELGRQLNINKLLVYAESVRDQREIEQHRRGEHIVWLTRNREKLVDISDTKDFVIELPDHKLSRTDQFQLGLLIAVLNDFIQVDETVLCLTGLIGSLRVDNLLITNLRRDQKWFQKHSFDKVPKEVLNSREFFRILDIALTFAAQGREGKPIGTIFVLGSPDQLEGYVSQLILNPCKGHDMSQCNIHNNGFLETLRELSALDGAFIIDLQGTVTRAAAYLNPPPIQKQNRKIPRGYGARHTAALALTEATDSLAVVLSESSASIIAFFKGMPILEMNAR